MKKAKAFFLAALLMIAPCFAKAGELSNEEILFFKERTAEWEAEFGQSETWNYLTIGMFCRIYRNYPDAEWEVITAILPTLPDIRLHTSCRCSRYRKRIFDWLRRQNHRTLFSSAGDGNKVPESKHLYGLDLHCILRPYVDRQIL